MTELIYVLEYFDTDYYNATCTTDPGHVMSQAMYAVVDDGELVGLACRACGERMTSS